MSEHTVTDTLTLLTRLAEPGVTVALLGKQPWMSKTAWLLYPRKNWPEDAAYLLANYHVEVFPSYEAACAAHPGANGRLTELVLE